MDYVGLVECCRRDACELARQWTEQQCRQCSIELESGGNIKFTAGEASLSWYKSCTDLINSRFSVDNTGNMVSVLESALIYFYCYATSLPPLSLSLTLSHAGSQCHRNRSEGSH